MTAKTLKEKLELHYARKKEQAKEHKREYIIFRVTKTRFDETYEHYVINPLAGYLPPDDEAYEEGRWERTEDSLNEFAGEIYMALRDFVCDTVIVYASLTDEIDNAPRLTAVRNQTYMEDPNFPVNSILLDLQKQIAGYFNKFNPRKPRGQK